MLNFQQQNFKICWNWKNKYHHQRKNIWRDKGSMKCELNSNTDIVIKHKVSMINVSKNSIFIEVDNMPEKTGSMSSKEELFLKLKSKWLWLISEYGMKWNYSVPGSCLSFPPATFCHCVYLALLSKTDYECVYLFLDKCSVPFIYVCGFIFCQLSICFDFYSYGVEFEWNKVCPHLHCLGYMILCKF